MAARVPEWSVLAIFFTNFGSCQWTNLKGLLHLVTLVTKLLYVVIFHEDITQPEPKTSGPWYTCDLSPHRVSSPAVQYFWRYSSFSPYRCRHILPVPRFTLEIGNGWCFVSFLRILLTVINC